jgi:WD40 repeat protein
MVSGGRDYFVRFWDVESGRELGRVSESWNVITALKWINGDTHCLAQASEDLSMRIWDSRTYTVAQKFSTDKYFPVS